MNLDREMSLLKAVVEQFETGFAKVMVAGDGQELPEQISFASGKIGTDEYTAKLLRHHVVRSIKNTFEEALKDWSDELAKLPKSGEVLYWRVRPEVEYSSDFPTRNRRCQIYARLAVNP